MNTTKLTILFIAICIFSDSLLASPEEKSTLSSYLTDTLQFHIEQEKYGATREYQQLGLAQGKRNFWPDITVHTSFDEATDEVDASSLSPLSRTVATGITNGIDANWTSLIGTQVTLGLEQQYGHQLGKESQGIPEDDMQAHTLSLEISQPLLKHNTPRYNRSDFLKSVLNWDHYRQENEVNRSEIIKNALLDYTNMQDSFDRWQILKAKLNFTRSLVKTTELLVSEGRNLPIDLDLALLDFRRGQQSVEAARKQFIRSQHKLTLQWTLNRGYLIPTQPNMQALLDLLTPVIGAQIDLAKHPEYTQASIESEITHIDEFFSERDHWPDLKAYYRVSKKYRDELPDEDNQAWGVELSYSFSNLQIKRQQALRRAEANVANLEQTELLQKLNWQADLHRQNSETLLSESALNNYGITLAEKALDQELKRFNEGQSSYRNVQLRQQDLLDRRLDTLLNKVELANELINLAYYAQWDWIERLPK